MSEYDQERISELSDELDRANEKIKCLEADLANARQELAKYGTTPGGIVYKVDPEAPAPFEPKVVPKEEEADFGPEASSMIRYLKAKGLILVVFSAQRDERRTGMSVQLSDPRVMDEVPFILQRMADKMKRDILMRPLRKQ
jgi:hypothetical protein